MVSCSISCPVCYDTVVPFLSRLPIDVKHVRMKDAEGYIKCKHIYTCYAVNI